ncbi:hypothetical protein QR680_000850 [Steinernema hermaphroditum]|uniref:ShKT domain-containing protein n=1 Tax=Steinernema hermaphroditum TaxID=289476 RepID=A0AA39GWT9_9BILA|nr:hypothetical protein QR680_000850 [Steinernema hermaphroditum]
MFPRNLTWTNDLCVENSPSCADINIDCVNKTYLCDNPVYCDFMTQQCSKTCGRCAAGGIEGNTAANRQDRALPSEGLSMLKGIQSPTTWNSQTKRVRQQ